MRDEVVWEKLALSSRAIGLGRVVLITSHDVSTESLHALLQVGHGAQSPSAFEFAYVAT